MNFPIACAADKGAKAVSAFVLDNYDISLHLLVSLYISVRNSGTKALKFDLFFSTLKGEKSFIYNGFHSQMLFSNEKTNTIFYKCK